MQVFAFTARSVLQSMPSIRARPIPGIRKICSVITAHIAVLRALIDGID